MNNKFLIGLVLVISLGFGIYFVTTPKTAEQLGPVFGAANAQAIDEIDISTINEMVIGAEDAPITVIEYASYTCPHCRSFHENIFKQLESNYIDTNKVRFIYREVYFDKPGLWASILARCEGSTQKFFAISDILYTKQSQWHKSGSTLPEVAKKLRQIGKSAGMSSDKIQSCFSDGKKATTLVEWYKENAQADGVTSTPSIFINGTKHSINDYAELKQILDAQ